MSNHTSTHAPHVLPLQIYLGVGAALLVLTVITVAVSLIPLGGWNLVVALAIASIKALLVASFFMHLYYDHKLYFIMFGIGVLILSVFIVLTMFDTLERGAVYDIKARPINPKAAMYDKPIVQDRGAATHGDTAKTGGSAQPTDSSAGKPDSAKQTRPSGH